LSTVFDEPYEVPSFEEVEVAEELLQRYVGEFISDQISLKLKVTVKDGKLIVQGSGQPPIPVVATSEAEFRADMVGAKLRFEQSEDNTAYDRMTLQQGGAEIKFKKQSR
jgi:D-alanyl-D-alanine carboxypeptidase